MGKSLKDKTKKLSFTIKPDQTKVRMFTEPGDFERYIGGIRCGNTVHKPKKGKGSYRRHAKHRHRAFH